MYIYSGAVSAMKDLSVNESKNKKPHQEPAVQNGGGNLKHLHRQSSNTSDKDVKAAPTSGSTNSSKDVKDLKASTSTPVTMTPVDPKTILFFDAIREGSVQKVKTIFRQKNLNLNTRNLNDPNNPTALIAACECDNAEIVKLLMTMKKQRSIDVNQEDRLGRRPIWWGPLSL